MSTNKSGISYHEPQQIEALPETEFNDLPFGAIQLDSDGVIMKYNSYEARLAGRDPREVIGQNFFTEVAPCTNVQEFAGRFREGIGKGVLNTTFPYRFLFPDNYIDVEITMILGRDGKSSWVFVKETQRANS